MEAVKRATLWRVAFFMAFGGALILLGYRLRGVLNPLLFAVLLAYVLNPLVNAISRRGGFSRLFGVLVVFILFFGISTLGALWTVPRAVAQVESLVNEVPGFYKKAVEWLEKNEFLSPAGPAAPAGTPSPSPGAKEAPPRTVETPSQQFLRQALEKARDSILKSWEEWKENLPKHATNAVQQILTSLQGLLYVLGFCLLVPVYLFFLLLEWPQIQEWAKGMLPTAGRERMLSVIGQIDGATAAFFRGRVVLCLVRGLLVFGLFAVAGAPYPLLFGVVAAVSSFVPFLHVFFVLVPSVVIGALQAHNPVAGGLAPGVVFLVIEAFMEFVLTPLYLGRQVSLHPVALFVVLLIGGDLLGFFGVIIAVPLACAAKILFREFVLPEWRMLAQREAPPPAI